MAQGEVCEIGANCSEVSSQVYTNDLGTFCNKHYLQIRRHGSVMKTGRDRRAPIVEGSVVKIPLGKEAKDGYAIVDKEFGYLAKDNWQLSHYGYARRSKDKKLLHRLITGAEAGQVVDHISGDPLDNTVNNLRVCTQSENAKNQSKRRANNSGYKGVTKEKRLYRARIKVNYAQVELGRFTSAIKAARAYNEAAIKYHGEFARLNELA